MYKKKAPASGEEGRRAMNANLASVLYLVSGVLFILALRGLSSPVTSRAGNRLGMIGMAIAILTTLATLGAQGALDPVTDAMILVGVAIGGVIGAIAARRIPMTAIAPAGGRLHSLVGLAACLVAVAALYAPDAFGITNDAFGEKVGPEAGIDHRAQRRRGHRRHHLHRLPDRLRQAQRQHERGRRSCCPSATCSTSPS